MCTGHLQSSKQKADGDCSTRTEEADDPFAQNYRIAREQAAFLEKKVEENLACHRMVKFSYRDAKARYGEKLLLGALGGVEEGKDKSRLIHDGPHKTLINNTIRARDNTLGPLIGDIAAMIEHAEGDDDKVLGFVWGFVSAHHMVQIHLRGAELANEVDIHVPKQSGNPRVLHRWPVVVPHRGRCSWEPIITP